MHRERDDLVFAYRQSSLDELVILDAEFELEEEDPDELTKRMQKQWIVKKANLPMAHENTGCIFKNPRGMSAGMLIDQCGLKGERVGGVEVSQRHANFFVAQPRSHGQGRAAADRRRPQPRGRADGRRTGNGNRNLVTQSVARVSDLPVEPELRPRQRPGYSEDTRRCPHGSDELKRIRHRRGSAGSAAPASFGSCSHCWSASVSPPISSGSNTPRRSPSIRNISITADDIHITPPPPWIRSDIKTKCSATRALWARSRCSTIGTRSRSASATRSSSTPGSPRSSRITKRLPSVARRRTEISPARSPRSNRRKPAASRILPIDEHAIRLPEADLTDAERRYLPRISGVTGRPLVGDAWDDPRVSAARSWRPRLADVWQKLRLVEIISPPQPQVRNDARVYSLRDHHQRRHADPVGATTGEEITLGESPFDGKATAAARLRRPARQARIDRRPRQLDVRSDLVVTPRTARKKPAANDESTTTK